MWRKIAALIFILGGLSLIVYPTLNDRYLEYQQKILIEQWRVSLKQLDDLEYGHNNYLSDKGQSAGQEFPNKIDLTKGMEGFLRINKINLQVPILTGATDENLNFAVASIEGTGRPGEIGNYCLAGHRSRTYGVLFNRLNELTKGDNIVVETKGETYLYMVTESMIVRPEDVQVLQSSGQRKQITLVTCDYSSKPYLRLIIKGELVSQISFIRLRSKSIACCIEVFKIVRGAPQLLHCTASSSSQPSKGTISKPYLELHFGHFCSAIFSSLLDHTYALGNKLIQDI